MNNLITEESGLTVEFHTALGFKFKAACLGGQIYNLLWAETPKGKKWKPHSNNANPLHLLSHREREEVTRRLIQKKLGYKIEVKPVYIIEVNGCEVRPTVFDKGPQKKGSKKIKFPHREIGRNRFETEEETKEALALFKEYYQAYLRNNPPSES